MASRSVGSGLLLVALLLSGCADLLGIGGFDDRPTDAGTGGSGLSATSSTTTTSTGSSGEGGAAAPWEVGFAALLKTADEDVAGGVAIDANSQRIVFGGVLSGALDLGCVLAQGGAGGTGASGPGAGGTGGSPSSCAVSTDEGGDPFLAAVDFEGRGQWARLFSTSSAARITSVSSYSGVWIAGTFEGSLTLGATLLQAADRDLFVARVDPTTGDALEAYCSTDIGFEDDARLAAQHGGTVVTVNRGTTGVLRRFPPTSAGSRGWITTLDGAKLTAVAASLESPWDYLVGGTAVGALSLCGHAFAAGQSFVARFGDAGGECVWVTLLDGQAAVGGLASGGDGSVVAVGSFAGAMGVDGASYESFEGTQDAFVAWLDLASGHVDQVRTSNATGDEVALDVASELGAVVVVGSLVGELGFAALAGNGDSVNGFVVAFDDHEVTSAWLLDGPFEKQLTHAALSGRDHAALLGVSRRGAWFGGYALGLTGEITDATNLVLAGLRR